MKKIKVLIVDDSAVVRQVAQAILEREPDVEVIGAASDPIFAIERMNRQWPDVIVLDIEMPRMDGITFLKKIMAEHPTPVVICSTLAEKGAATTMQALEAGAVEIITKPQIGLKRFLEESSNELVTAVRAAAQANVRHIRTTPIVANPLPSSPSAPAPARGIPAESGRGWVNGSVPPKLNADAILAAPGNHAMAQTTERIVAIGTSTGGTQALEVVLKGLPRTAPGIVVVQHMPEKFTAMFAERLDSLCALEVREACDGDRVLPGRALIAPGGRHMMLKRSGAQYYVEVADGPLVNRHKPSVDVLFRSVAKYAGKNALGIIMTGMGDDGARGMSEMKQAKAFNLAQDEESCVVFGMPQEAIKHGGVDKVLPLDRLADEVMRVYRSV